MTISKKQKTILVIDYEVPAYDHNTGSRNTYTYILLFLKMGLKVIFLSDEYKRKEPYSTELEKLGVKLLTDESYKRTLGKWMRQYGPMIDYVYLHRPNISVKYIDLLKARTKAKILYYAHDLHYLRSERGGIVEHNKAMLDSSEYWKKLEFSLFPKLDVIYVPSLYEYRILKSHFPQKTIRVIPVLLFDQIDNGRTLPSFEEREGILFVGGYKHKPNTDGVIWFANKIFPSIVKSNPNMKFYAVGSSPPYAICRLRSSNFVVTGYVSDSALEDFYRTCRLVIAPLRYGAGVKGKIAEAFYHQVPVVTTSIGAEGFKEIDKYALIADDPKEFSENTIRLYNDKKLWQTFSGSYKEYVNDQFSYESALRTIQMDIQP